MQPTMSFNLLGGPGVRVTVVQTEDGRLEVTASVLAGGLVGDLRGLFFHVTDQSLLGGLSVSGGTSPLGALHTGANAVSNLGAGVSMAGAAQPFDAGLTFGSASAAGADDIRSVSFTLSHASQALTLDSLAGMQFGAVLTSVGIQGGARFGTTKATGLAPVNLAPDAVNDSATVGEEGSVAVAVLGNDTDPHHDALAIQSFTQPSAGVVTQVGNDLVFEAAGAFDWLAVNEQTQVTFTYTVSDGRGGSDTATVTITVTGENDGPSAENQQGIVFEDDAANGAASGSLLAGASDPDTSDTLTVTEVNGAAATTVDGVFGTLAWNAAGGFTYTLDNARAATNALLGGQEETESFVFTVSDGNGGTVTRTLTIIVVGANDAATVGDDARTVQEDGLLVGSVEGLASDAEGDGLSFALVGDAPAGLVFNADGTYTYTPPADFNGQVSFQYVADDGTVLSNIGTVTIDVLPVNDAPTVTDDSRTVQEDGVLNGSVVGLAQDVEGDALTFALVGAAPAGLVFNADGTYTYTPPADFEGAVSFQYRANDGALDSNIGTVSIDVLPVNDAPTDIALTNASVAENSAAGTLVGLLSATDVDGGPASFSFVGDGGPFQIVGNRLEVAGALDYETQASYSVTIRADDGAGGTYDETFVISITDVNEGGGNAPPVVQNANETVLEDGVLNGAVTGNDPDGDPLSFELVSSLPGLSFDVSGGYIYTPPANFNGQVSFQYRANDGTANSNTGTVTITVTPVNDAPTEPDGVAATIDEDTTTFFSLAQLLAGATDVDGDVLSVAGFDGNGQLSGFFGNNGVENGIFVSSAVVNQNGPALGFYTVSDGNGGTSTGTISLTITPVNDAPTVASTTYAATEDTPRVFSIAALLADLADDVDGDAVSFVSATSPAGGTLAVDGDTLTFTPTPDYAGIGWFFLTVTDGALNGGNWIYLDIAEVNDAPVAADDDVVRTGADPQVIAKATLFGNDSDIDSPQAGWSVVLGTATGGTVSLDGNGNVLFDYTPGHVGAYSFTYQVNDGEGGLSNLATVTLNGPPAAGDDTATVAENDAYYAWQAVNVVGNDSDPDNDPLTVTAASLVGNAAPIVVSWDSDQVFFYSTDSAWFGSFEISYTISDGRGGTDSAIISVTVTPSNDAPTVVPDYVGSEIVTTDELTPILIPFATLLANDSHEDGTSFTITSVEIFHRGTAALVDTDSDGAADSVLFTPQVQNDNFYDFSNSWLAYFYYTVTDTDGDTAQTYAYVRVNDVNQAPAANDDTIARQPGPHVISFDTLFANDVDFDSPVSGWTISGITNQSGVTAVVDNTARTVTVTYDAGFTGTYGFTYTLSDGEGGTDTANVVLDTAPAQTGPVSALVINEDSWHYIYDADLIALAGVTDVDGDTLFVSGPIIAGPNLYAFDNWGAPIPNYVYVATDLLDWNGASTLTFTVSDGHPGGTIEVTIPVTVTPVNDAPRDPEGNDDALGLTVAEDTPLIVSIAALLGDDFNPADEAQVVNLYQAGPWWYGVQSVVDNGDGTLTVNPLTDFEGETRFYYLAQDEQGAVGYYVTVLLTVTGTPDPIDAVDDDIARTGAGTQTVLASQMLGNDVDPDVGDTKDIISVTAGNGITAVTLNADDSVDVTFAGSYSGPASYTYTVRDSQGNEDTATVQLFRTPVANPDGPFTFEEANNTYLFIPFSTLFGNDLDGDGPGLSIYSYDYGYTGSNVYLSGSFSGVFVYLLDNSYSGPAEFQYRAWDGVAVSNWTTVTIDVVAGNDAPVAAYDYWFYNGAAYSDTNPATNPMAGTEDTVMEFAVSLLLDGQFIGGGYLNGADTDEEGDPLLVVASSLFSPFGTVELINIGGEDTIRFTPNADVNSQYPWGGVGYYDIWFSYRVTDGDRESENAYVYLYLAGTDDTPEAVDDVFNVVGNGPWVLPIGDFYSQYSVLANDRSPDDYPYALDSSYTTIIGVSIVSGIASLVWDGSGQVTVTADGTGDPIVFSYTIRDYDGDTDTALVTLHTLGQEPQRFYFSGSVPGHGRELWVYDPASYDENLNSAFATMVDEAETWPGPESGNPQEITALGGTVFWRGTKFVDSGEGGGFLSDQWHAYAPSIGYRDLGYQVAYYAFDNTLDPSEQNLGVRAGDLFWGATYVEGETLVAWDQLGNQVGSAYLSGYDRHLLTDAGGQPAYAATDYSEAWNPDIEDYDYFDAEQLFAALYIPGYDYWEVVRITQGGSAANDIREIAATSVTDDGFGGYYKTFYFAGDFGNDWQGTHANGLWRVTTTSYGYDWNGYYQAELISDAFAEANPYALTMAVVPDGAGGTLERLFWFQSDAGGNGQIATRRDNYATGSNSSTGTDFLGEAFVGDQIRQWQDGVIFSGTAGSGDFVAIWTDPEGDDFFFYDIILMKDVAGDIEQLVVDGLGNAAWIVDDGVFDTVWLWNGNAINFVDSKYGEITDLQMAGGTLVYVANNDSSFTPTLFSFDIAALSGFEVPTDESTDAGGADGYNGNSGDNIAVPGGMFFDGNDGGGNGLYRVESGVVSATFGTRYTSAVEFGGDWVGGGFFDDGSGYAEGLYRINSGSITRLFDTTGIGIRGEVELIGNKVLFGDSAAGSPTIRAYDLVAGTDSELLTGRALGTAEMVGSEIIFSAWHAASNTWDLYAWNGTGTPTFLADLPATTSAFTPTGEWRGELDFLGDGNFVFFKHNSAAVGEEVHVLNRAAGTITALDIFTGTFEASPGVFQPNSGARWGDAVFANGRLFFQASPDGTSDSMRLYTTTDGTDLSVVTATELVDPGYQFPWLPEVIGNKVYFLGNTNGFGSNTWGIFELNSDGIANTADDTTATLISPLDFGFIYALEAIGGDLYFSEFEGSADQVWRMTPGSAPEQLTFFADEGGGIDNYFLGGDGNIYFARDTFSLGRELWVLDASMAEGARLVADLNTNIATGGYAPEQVVAVPDPFDYQRMLEAWYGSGEGGGGVAS